MGTRSQTAVYDDGKKLVQIYKQFDGYPSGLGKKLAEFLAPVTMVNGMLLGETHRVANGAGCLAAQLIAALKDGAGGVYLEPPTTGLYQHDYTYELHADTFNPSAGIRVVVHEDESKVFDGTVKEFKSFCTEEEEES